VVPLAVSIIPAIAGVVAQNNKKEAGSIVQSSVKLTNLFAMPACGGIMVLAGPILNALYYDPSQTPEAFATMTSILVILGAASYFVCFQHLTIAVLQANGYERVALMTFPVGAAVKITLSYFLVGNPNYGILGSPIGTLFCFSLIAILNVIFITVKVKERFKLISGFLKPLICAVIMACVSYLTYEGAQYLGAGSLGTGNTGVIIYLAAAIIVGVLVYAALIVLTRTITKDDLSHIPKGDKLAKLLRVK
jgi:stage V sporulation protein B